MEKLFELESNFRENTFRSQNCDYPEKRIFSVEEWNSRRYNWTGFREDKQYDDVKWEFSFAEPIVLEEYWFILEWENIHKFQHSQWHCRFKAFSIGLSHQFQMICILRPFFIQLQAYINHWALLRFGNIKAHTVKSITVSQPIWDNDR